MIKKLGKILLIVFGIVLLLLLVAPFLFKESLEDLLKKNLNENLAATVEWQDLKISLFRSFPNAAVSVKDFSIVNQADFPGDTLARGEAIHIDMGITQLFKRGDDPIKVNGLSLEGAYIDIKVDSFGRASYDIGKKVEAGAADDPDTENDSGFSFDLSKYAISDTEVRYSDENSRTYLHLKDLNHSGKGDFSLDQMKLDSETDVIASLRLDKIAYLNENRLRLDALLNMDLKNQKFSFLENEARINDLPLTFDGFVDINEEDTELDLTFKTPSSDFKNFLAVIPKTYVKDIKDVSTSGDFIVDGKIFGTANEELVPKMNIRVSSNNASFKYPDLPKAVNNIAFDAQLKNETGLSRDTYLSIGGLTFKIDDELFTANGTIRNLAENALINLALKGTLNLANIEKVLPIKIEQDLTGVFKADITTNFDMASVENEQYQDIKTTGSASLEGFTYQDDYFRNQIKVTRANVTMKPGDIVLKEMVASTGQSDITARGNIKNLIPWIMAKQDLKGNFTVNSNTFDLDDFGNAETALAANEKNNNAAGSSNAADKEGIKIPDFLDATLHFDAKRLIYDNVELTNSKGTVTIRDEKAKLSNVTSSVFGGDVALSGDVSTKGATPIFNMNLDLQRVDIDESFGALDLLKYLAPIAKALDGNLNSTFQLSGELNNDLTPKLSTLAGSALTQILTAEVSPEKTPLLSKVGEQLSFLDMSKVSLQNLTTALTFDNGNIRVQPFSFKIKDVTINAAGSHGLDKSVDYQLSLDVPAKYLGSDVTKLLNKLDPKEANTMKVTLPAGIKGSLTSPRFTVDTNGAVADITQRLIEKQKQELKNKGTDILQDLITGDNKPKNTNNNPKGNNKTTPTNSTEKVVKGIFNDIFGNNKKKDSTKTRN